MLDWLENKPRPTRDATGRGRWRYPFRLAPAGTYPRARAS
jgi:hypothetical protein